MAFRKVSLDRIPSSEEVLSITKSGLGFAAEFIKKNDLTEKLSVSFYLDDEDPYKLGFEFYDSSGENNTLMLMTSGRGKYTSNGRTVKAGELIAKNKIIQAIQKEPNKNSRTFPIKKARQSNIYFVMLRPSFELNVPFSKKNLIDDDLIGIYRYKDDNNKTIYIGKGIIKSRASSPDRKDWGIKTIEYSILSSDTECLRWEDHYLTTFQNEYGTLPLFNRILGHSDKS